MIINSPYGKVRLLTPLFKSSGLEDVQHYQVVDTIRTSVLFKRMRSEKTIEFIDSEAEHSKILAIHKNLKYRLSKDRHNYQDKSSQQIFHLYRRNKQDRIHFFGRLGFVVSSNFEVLLKNAPDVSILGSAIRTFLQEPHDVFMPLNIWEGILSANEWTNKGIFIQALNAIIHPIYGVWAPTNQDYLSLLQKYLLDVKLTGTAVDLGCGTGVLSFMLAKHGMQVFAIDSLFQAAKCTNLNAKVLDLDVNAVCGEANDVNIPNCEVLICNPPWIPVSKSSVLDSGVYDPEEKLLKSAFMQTKKLVAGGRFLLFYSDLAQNLGLQSADRIEELCKQHELKISQKMSKPFPVTMDQKNPLKKWKDNSHIFFYEITRI